MKEKIKMSFLDDFTKKKLTQRVCMCDREGDVSQMTSGSRLGDGNWCKKTCVTYCGNRSANKGLLFNPNCLGLGSPEADSEMVILIK